MGKLKLLVLALFACGGFGGCRLLSSSSSSESVKGDRLLEEIVGGETVEAKAGWWRKDPAVVLKEIPIGTPVDQAKAVMEAHGFKCSEQPEQNGPFLLCHAFKRTGFLTGTGIDIKIVHHASRVTNVEVVTSYSGP